MNIENLSSYDVEVLYYYLKTGSRDKTAKDFCIKVKNVVSACLNVAQVIAASDLEFAKSVGLAKVENGTTKVVLVSRLFMLRSYREQWMQKLKSLYADLHL